MDILEVMKKRHSVRKFTDQPLNEEDVQFIQKLIAEINDEANLHIQLMANEKVSFASFLGMITYGHFSNVNNYLAMVSNGDDDSLEKIGYYGEKIVLELTKRGLGTCWVAGSLSKKKTKYEKNEGEKLHLIIMVGNISKEGVPHKSKTIEELSILNGKEMPEWFHRGMEAVLLAPSAMNQQKVKFELLDHNKVRVHADKGIEIQVDKGIAKYHFEIAAGKDHFSFEN